MARRCVFEGEDDEEDLFFDSREDISSSADSCPGSPQKQFPSSSEENFVGCRVWVSNLDSVRERRDKFARLMGMDLNYASGKLASDFDGELLRDDEIAPDIERIMSDDGAVLRSSSSDNGSSSISSWSTETPSTSGDGVSEENFECRIKNLNDGTVFLVDELGKDGSVRSLREVGSNQTVTVAEFGKKFGSSSFIQQHMRRDDSSSTSSDSDKTVSRRRTGWLRRLGIGAFVVDREKIETKSRFSEFDQSGGAKVERVKVRTYKKKSKEFSAVYKRQDIKAHDGAILTMKFSPDGELLATGGEDGVVRVWQVMECEPSDDCCIPEDDPACIYFTVNENSELVPLHANSEKKGKTKNMKRSTDSACVVIPSNVFRISHEPLHEFRGHVGDVLDLSWSKDKHLLSSSIDKTVRLWQIGCTSCLNVFSHRNYVTSVQFDPNNENYFVSGSIDGKVRIWEISRCHVVDWTDVKDIVTAVCYRQEGKGVVVGTITGNCRFYDASDNHLQLEAQLSLQGRKKSPHKRITGFQFCPTDPKKLLVTSADSKIRILDGVDIVCKYKGIKSASSQISASFTPGGHHIISASEDSNIYIWNHENQDGPTVTHAKSTWSCERFFSSNASVAIPWNGSSQKDIFRDLSMISEDLLVGSGNFTLSHEYFAGFLPRGSATWPEEKLPCDSISASTLDRAQYKFLQASCQSASRAWGRVIVTAGWDGRIRSFQNCGLPLHL